MDKFNHRLVSILFSNSWLSSIKSVDLSYANTSDTDTLYRMVRKYANENKFQVFIVNPEFNEDITIAATKKMGNTLYYDYKKVIFENGYKKQFGTGT